MPVFDPQKLTGLVDEESRLSNGLNELIVSLNEQHETDAEWDEPRQGKYIIDQQRHRQLTRQLETVRAERQRYEAHEPQRVKQFKQSALNRWLWSGENGLEQDECELYLREPDPAMLNQVPDLRGNGFRVSLATRSDIDTGAGAAGLSVEQEWNSDVIERLAY